MQLTKQTDYALRILLYLAERPEKKVQLQEIYEFHKISKSLVTKTASQLVHSNYIASNRGRYGGGITLLKSAEEIFVAEIVRNFEPTMNLAECFNRETNTCSIVSNCRLKISLANANKAFLASLEDVSIASLIGRKLLV